MLRKAAAATIKPSISAPGPKLGAAAAAGPPVMALTPTEGFVLGAIAKFTATVATYPLQLAQSRLRSEASSKAIEKASAEESPAASSPSGSSDAGNESRDSSGNPEDTDPASSAVAPYCRLKRARICAWTSGHMQLRAM